MSGCQYGFMTSGMYKVAGTRQVQDLVTGQVPEILVENLHLDGAGVASGLNGSAQATQFDGPIAHHTAREQQIGGRNQPVADVKAQDVAGGRGDLRVDLVGRRIIEPKMTVRSINESEGTAWCEWVDKSM